MNFFTFVKSTKPEKFFKKEQISLFAQIREDFTRLQVINNEMMQTVFLESKVDRKLIAATTAEINKRATRLSRTLVLPKIEDKETNQKSNDSPDFSLHARLLALEPCSTAISMCQRSTSHLRYLPMLQSLYVVQDNRFAITIR